MQPPLTGPGQRVPARLECRVWQGSSYAGRLRLTAPFFFEALTDQPGQAGNMTKRFPPWFWNRAVLGRLAWLLLAIVFVAYAGRVLTLWAIQ